MGTDGVDSADRGSDSSGGGQESGPDISDDARESLDGGSSDESGSNQDHGDIGGSDDDDDGPEASSGDAYGDDGSGDDASGNEDDDDLEDEARTEGARSGAEVGANGYDEVGTDVPADEVDPNEPTAAERAATQERMAIEGQAARQAYENRQAAPEGYEVEAYGLGAPEADVVEAELELEPAEVAPADIEVADLQPTLRDQILADADDIDPTNVEERLAEIDAFLASPEGVAASKQFEFDRALQNSDLTPEQAIEAMGHFTSSRELVYDEAGAIVTLEDGSVAWEVQVADADGGFDAALEERSTAEIAADYARGLNETMADIANSNWAWAAGLAFDAVSLAAGGPVKFAIGEVAGAGAAELLSQGVEAGAEYIAERSDDLDAEDVAHLAIAGGTIIGGLALGWNGVKHAVKNLPETVGRIQERVQDIFTSRRRDDDPAVHTENDRRTNDRDPADIDPDPARAVMGPASRSHPAEIVQMRRELEMSGVEIVERPGAMAYAPGLREGEPGQFFMDPDASFSAWSHEYQHFLDDRAMGWGGMRSMMDPDVRWDMERSAYDREIDLMEELGHTGVADDLRALRELERIRIFGD